MTITDKAMSNLSFALRLTENVDANTLMLCAAVRINRLQAENAAHRAVLADGEPVLPEAADRIEELEIENAALKIERDTWRDIATTRMRDLAKAINDLHDQAALRDEIETLKSLESRYANTLGQLAQKCDIVCSWVQSKLADPPSGVWEAAGEIMEYVEAVRP